MRVEIISTGDEIIRGKSIDTNAAWLSAELTNLGLDVRYHTTVGDEPDAIIEAIRAACNRAELVLFTGGLGPTEDDHTRNAVSEAFGLPLEFRSSAFRTIQRRFRSFRVPMAKANRLQAFFPKTARELPNAHGTAPGFLVERPGSVFVAMPGVPGEMKPMFHDHVRPKLPSVKKSEFLHIRSFGMPEGHVDELVSAMVKRVRGGSYGLTAKGGSVTIVLRVTGADRKKAIRSLHTRLRKKLGDVYVGEGTITLSESIASLLRRRRASIAVSESCTGGLVSARLTEVPGISESLLESVVTYSNESKMKRLGVSEALLRKHGAVSPQVARAMAEGVARTSGAAVGVSTTGIAGPSGGTKKKPVGLVYMAVAYDGTTTVKKRIFPGNRKRVQDRSANLTLNLIRLRLLHD